MRPGSGSLLLLLLLLFGGGWFASPRPAAGQERTLTRVGRLIEEGRFEEGRALLESWLGAEWDRAPRGDREEGLWLRALLTIDPAIAELDYRRLVIEFPGGRYSDQALLRLAQIAESQGEAESALRYLETLVRDYPQSPHRVEARAMMGRLPAGAGTSGAGGALPATEAAVSSPGGAAPLPPPAVAPSTADPTPSGIPPASAAANAPSPGGAPSSSAPTLAATATPYAVQLGAFSVEAPARALASDPRLAGIPLRVVQTEGSPLFRVRMGAFPSEEAAREALREVERRGLPAIVSTDRERERVLP